MSQQYHFISGLPRSGTTLLSTILNQNPNFYASISSPLMRFCKNIIDESSAQKGYRKLCPEYKREKIIKGIFDNFYEFSDIENKRTHIFDTNRGWTLLTPLLKQIFPNFKMIVCVRQVPWILDSFEQLFRKNPLSLSTLFSKEENISVYSRCATLLRPDRVLGFALEGVKQSLQSNETDSLFVLDYDLFVKNPEQAIRTLYQFLGEENYYPHDFNNLKIPAFYEDFDEDLNLPGLHSIRPKVEFKERKTIIPQDIIEQFKQPQTPVKNGTP